MPFIRLGDRQISMSLQTIESAPVSSVFELTNDSRKILKKMEIYL